MAKKYFWDIDEIVDALITYYRTEMLKAGEENN